MTDPVVPAHERLTALFLLLAAEAPRPSDTLTASVMRTARRQHVVRRAVAVLEELAAALASALGVLLGIVPPTRPRPAGA